MKKEARIVNVSEITVIAKAGFGVAVRTGET